MPVLDRNFTDARFPAQYISRPNLDFRSFCAKQMKCPNTIVCLI